MQLRPYFELVAPSENRHQRFDWKVKVIRADKPPLDAKPRRD